MPGTSRLLRSFARMAGRWVSNLKVCRCCCCTRGARTGQPRINPLAYTRDGERYVVIASKGGAPTNPDWYYNVIANPLLTLEVGTEQFQAEATIPGEPER